MTVSEAEPFRVQSLRGHTDKSAEGFPRHYPPSIASSLGGSRLGLRRYERVFVRNHFRNRATLLPDKEFRSWLLPITNLVIGVGRFRQPPQIALGVGPSHPLY
jgi:hypothetical protein